MTRRDIVIALWVVFLWSSNLVVQKFAVAHLSIFVLSFLRIVLVLPLLFLYPKPQKSIWKYAICGFFLSALYLTLFGFGLQNIGAGISAFFIQLQVFFGILCCFLILGEKPQWFQMVGIAISSVGIYFLKASSSPAELPLMGIAFLIGSSFSYGVGIALSKKYKIGQTMADLTWLSTTATIPLFLSCLVFEGPVPTFEIILNMSLTVMLCIVFATLVSTLWATYLWLNLIQRSAASSVVPFMLLLPIFSNIISYVFLGETLSTYQIISGFIIVLGVMFVQGIHRRIPVFLYWLKGRAVS